MKTLLNHDDEEDGRYIETKVTQYWIGLEVPSMITNLQSAQNDPAWFRTRKGRFEILEGSEMRSSISEVNMLCDGTLAHRLNDGSEMVQGQNIYEALNKVKAVGFGRLSRSIKRLIASDLV